MYVVFFFGWWAGKYAIGGDAADVDGQIAPAPFPLCLFPSLVLFLVIPT